MDNDHEIHNGYWTDNKLTTQEMTTITRLQYRIFFGQISIFF
ncbi:hypothetical protein ZOSMA_299G00020 [Zostera marina]|uniref:Uncharacterized protein n=1 Tax=Zostera marina TaxID=29655 RepID=A0A0K9PE38_ZOSMR|nr:hypothetical protein ZOSMA_299G00020 [Zostera marina]